MNQTMVQENSKTKGKIGRFGLLLAAAVIAYIGAIMVFIVVY
jgi:hypothetical protein